MSRGACPRTCRRCTSVAGWRTSWGRRSARRCGGAGSRRWRACIASIGARSGSGGWRTRRAATPLAQQLRYWDEFFSWGLERARYPLLEAALAYLRREKPGDEPVGLCWGDARLGNQVFDGGRCVAVLDWEMASLGNPVSDLAWWIALDRCFSEGVGAERLAGFPERAATIARWEALTGRR